MGWIKNWIAGSLKKLAVAIVQSQGDVLQAKLKAAVCDESDHCKLCDRLDTVIDKAQRKTVSIISTSGPSLEFLKPIRSKLSKEIIAHGDKLQLQLREEIKAKGPSAIDGIFDKAQATLIANIEALSL